MADYARGFTPIGHSDQGGRPDAMQMQHYRDHVYVGHVFSAGFTVIDARDPRGLKPRGFYPAPPDTWNIHLQAADDLLLVVHAKDLWAQFRQESAYYAGSVGTRLAGVQRDWSAGVAIYDLAKPAEPRQISFLPVEGIGVHRLWYPGGRWAYASEAVADEVADGLKYTWVFTIAEPANPVSIATFPTPAEADYARKGGHFGPHNLHENRPGSFVSDTLIFATYQNAGIRAVDITDPYRPREAGALVPPAPDRIIDPRPGRPKVVQTADVFVTADGIVYATDYNAGLTVAEYTG